MHGLANRHVDAFGVGDGRDGRSDCEPREAFFSIAEANADGNMPFFFRFVLKNMHLLAMAVLVLSAITLAISIGLLLRRNWARIGFIAILGLTAVFAPLGFMTGSTGRLFTEFALTVAAAVKKRNATTIFRRI